jgi:hypothetical protein
LYKRQQILVNIQELEETLQETPDQYEAKQDERKRKASEELHQLKDAITKHNVRGCRMITRATLAESADEVERQRHELLQKVCNGDDVSTHEHLAHLFASRDLPPPDPKLLTGSSLANNISTQNVPPNVPPLPFFPTSTVPALAV